MTLSRYVFRRLGLMRLKLALTIICLSFAPLPLRAQGESHLVTTVEHAIKEKEPKWQYIRGICTCPPLIPTQTRVDVTEWVRKGKAGQRESINIDFYEVASSADAAQWMTRFDRGEVSKDWQANRYELGDESYLLKYRNGSRYSIYFRKNHIVVEVSGTALKGVERFAKYVAEMTAT